MKMTESNEALGINSNCVSIMSVFPGTENQLYLINNGTKNNIELVFENGNGILMNSIATIVKEKPIYYNELRFGAEAHKVEFSYSLGNAEEVSVHRTQCEFKKIDQTVVNLHFDHSSQFKSSNENYLYQFEFPSDFLKHVTVEEQHGKILVIVPRLDSKFTNTYLKFLCSSYDKETGIIYTNNIVHSLSVMKKIDDKISAILEKERVKKESLSDKNLILSDVRKMINSIDDVDKLKTLQTYLQVNKFVV